MSTESQPTREAACASLERQLKHCFTNKNLLRAALTHSTFVHEAKVALENYERLEFLGDAVLGLVVSELLYQTFEHATEGELSRRRARLVQEQSLAQWADALHLGPLILLGQGQRAQGVPTSVLADVFEAVIGALFIDGGLDKARAFLTPIVESKLHKEVEITDAKTLLQEWCQRFGLAKPSYALVATHGPSHGRTFVIEVRISGRSLGRGEARSKKAAEQICAQLALGALQHEAG